MLKRLLFRLRVEEAIALAFLLPTTWLTIVAYDYARAEGVLGARYPGGVVRLGVAVVLLTALALAARRWPASGIVRGLRETVPFLACVLIYTNLHDTIGFVNSHDVHYWLIALDDMMFGVQPCVWAEQFITPGRTEVMQFFYLNFFWIAPSASFLLLLKGRPAAFRAATLGVIICFYLGYALYVLFPAAPPRLVLIYDFTKNLRGYPVGFLESLGPGVRPSARRQPSCFSIASHRRLPRGPHLLLAPPAGLVLDTAALRAGPVGVHDLPPPPLRGGPDRRLVSRPVCSLGGPPSRCLVGATAKSARVRPPEGLTRVSDRGETVRRAALRLALFAAVALLTRAPFLTVRSWISMRPRPSWAHTFFSRTGPFTSTSSTTVHRFCTASTHLASCSSAREWSP